MRCCSIASSSRVSSSSSSEMWRPLLLGFQRRRAAAGRRPLASGLDGFLVRAVSSSSSPSSSSSSPSSFPPPRLAPLPAALARARARASTPDLTFRVAGVSFEGRQRAASCVKRNQPLLLARERSNDFDPRAVAVLTLDGREQIGYVPRAETDKVLPGDADATFAFVRSVGRAHLKEGEEGEEREGEERGGAGPEGDDEGEGRGGESRGGEGRGGEGEGGGEAHEELRLGPWGVSVALKPGLPPLEIDALPLAISSAGPLSRALPGGEWGRLAREAAVASGFRCSVTGGVGGGGGGGEDGGSERSAPVEVHEHWRFDDSGRVATLLAVRALCPEAHDVAHALSLRSPEAKARALLTLRTVNGWSSEDASLYWRGREELAASRSDGGSEGGGDREEEQQTPNKAARKKEETSSSPPPSWRIDARWLASRGVDLGQLSPAWRELLV